MYAKLSLSQLDFRLTFTNEICLSHVSQSIKSVIEQSKEIYRFIRFFKKKKLFLDEYLSSTGTETH